jgi:saccharopine dehydrogenase-like NADP-dependent oxidoreductase
MRIIVLGGAGAMGQVTVRALSEYPDIDQIVLADYNENRARQVAATLNSSKVAVRQIDVNDQDRLGMLLQGCREQM